MTQFTAFFLKASLRVPAGTNVDQARRLLARAEEGCLISSSLKAPVHIAVDVQIEQIDREEHVAGVVPAVEPSSSRFDPHSRVDDAAARARRQSDHRIQIEFGDLGHAVGEPREAQQDVAQGLDIGRRVAAVPLQQRKPLIS